MGVQVKAGLIAVGVIVLMVGGYFVLTPPPPFIIVSPEIIFDTSIYGYYKQNTQPPNNKVLK